MRLLDTLKAAYTQVQIHHAFIPHCAGAQAMIVMKMVVKLIDTCFYGTHFFRRQAAFEKLIQTAAQKLCRLPDYISSNKHG
jgi:hypothetical protein